MKTVIILPTYNEKGNVERLVNLLETEIFPKIKDHQMYILVADDNSPDGTADEVKKLMRQWDNIALCSGEKKGLGAAYVRGMTYAIEQMNAEIMFEMDADGQHDPAKIPEFLKKIDQGYDMVIGTRYSGGGSIPHNWPVSRKAFSIIGNITVRMIFMRFSIHDWTGGYRAVKKEVFLKEKEELTSFRGYTFQVAFLHKAARDGFKIAEVPFHFTDRTLGKSKIVPKEYIIDLLKYVIFARIKELARFIKFLFVGGTGFIIQVITQELSIRFGMAYWLALFFFNIASGFSHQVSDLTELSHGIGAGFGAEAAILSNFFFNNLWTFSDTTQIKESAGFFTKLVKFNLASLASIFIQFFAVWITETIVGQSIKLFSYSMPTRLVVLIPTIILLVIPLNYLVYNKIIWKTQFLKHEKSAEK